MYEFLGIPYGLCNAPATFQRLMQNCLGELNLTYALVYLEDVIMYSKMEEDHLRWLQAVFERFYEHRLKLKPSKCRFLRKQITFLGHEVSADGMKPSNLNLKGIAEMAPPANYMEVRHFLRMTRFFRRFIKNYARIAKPLNDILEGEASKLKSEAVTLPPDALDAFEKLKMCCMTAPILAFADFEEEFQGRDGTLSLMKGQFWWPGMAMALCLAIQNCGRCKQFEAKCQLPEMEPIVCTQPMELVHVDYVGMEVTMAAKEKPVVKNVLVVVDHFTLYVQAFITKNHTA